MWTWWVVGTLKSKLWQSARGQRSFVIVAAAASAVVVVVVDVVVMIVDGSRFQARKEPPMSLGDTRKSWCFDEGVNQATRNSDGDDVL